VLDTLPFSLGKMAAPLLIIWMEWQNWVCQQSLLDHQWTKIYTGGDGHHKKQFIRNLIFS